MTCAHPEDTIEDDARPPDPQRAMRVAFVQNTLEQAVLAVTIYIALAPLLPARGLSLIPAAGLLFVLGRLLFLRG